MKTGGRSWRRRAIVWMGLCLSGCFYAMYARKVEGSLLHAMDRIEKSEDMMGEGMGGEAESKEQKIAYLTFDDGPSNHTNALLDILKEENVRATFFVVGKEDEESREMYQRIVREGHSLGLHSYSHVYKQVYSSVENFQEDVWKLKTYLYHVTGVSCDIYRFPGGSTTTQRKFSLEEGVHYLEEKGIRYFDWNATAEDAVCVQSPPSVLIARVLKDALQHEKAVILMHDLNCCQSTLQAVRPLIDRLKKEGYTFAPLTRDSVLE